jgi:NADH-quinone oxidoreductase subunit J
MTYEFLLAAAVAVVSTLFVVTRLNVVHALLYLVVSLLATAVMFLTLGTAFLAALEVIIYAGAIMVLFVFTAVMLDLGKHSIEQEKAWLGPKIWAGPGALTFALALEFLWIATGASTGAGVRPVALERVAGSLFTTYAAGVELASVLLMAGLVGAYHLGRREPRGERP